MDTISLQLQPDGPGTDQLAVFLIAPGLQRAFSVSLPPRLLQSQAAWRSRFLAHHSSAGSARPPAEVVSHYGTQLLQTMQQWLQQDDWLPLQQTLERHPTLPLLIRCQDSQLEALPWESLPLARPIWRQPPALANGQLAATATRQPPLRRPRVLLLVGIETSLRLDAEIEALLALQRQGRIALTTLRTENASTSALQKQLLQLSGWDVLVFLGHSERDGGNGGRLQLGDGSWVSGAALQQELSHAAAHGLQLVLLSSCSGTDLASACAAAGVPWTICFREPVPDQAASASFTALIQSLQAGSELAVTFRQVQRLLDQRGPAGTHLLLSGYTAGLAPPLVLPLQGHELLRRRLSSSNRQQLMAAASCTLLAAISALVPWNPVSTYLLDRRLDIQRQWRELTRQSGPVATPLPVLLIDPSNVQRDYGTPPTPGRLPRLALSRILERTPVAGVPRVGLDVVLDGEAPHTNELAAVLRRQQRPLVFSGWLSADSAAANPGDRTRRLAPALQTTNLQTRRLDVNTPGLPTPQALQPLPLRLQDAITAEHFAAALSDHPAPLLPADAVIDWSLNWSQLIRRLEPDDLATLQSNTLLVGSTGNVNPDHPDLFEAPGAAAQSLARISGGSTRQIPGALVQAALAQSLTLRHWLHPVPVLPLTALSAGLGVLVAAAMRNQRRRQVLVAVVAVAAVPLSLQMAVSQLLLVPLLLPLIALSSCAVLRKD